MDKDIINNVKARVNTSDMKNWDSAEEALKLGITCGIVQAYAQGSGTVEVLWHNEALIRYLEMEVPRVIYQAIIKHIPVSESSKSTQSSAKSGTVLGAEQK